MSIEKPQFQSVVTPGGMPTWYAGVSMPGDPPAILLETLYFILLENGSKILLE